MAAEVKILIQGHTSADSKAETGGEEKTCPTITLVKDGDLLIVVDPGILDSQKILVDALKKECFGIEDVDMVCITHSHIDHYRNIGMFPDAKTLEYFGVWDKGVCEDWQEQFTPNIQILRTPGHDYTSIALFVRTDEGIIAVCGDVFWKENGPVNDMYASDMARLSESRSMVLNNADFVIPGHGPMFKAEKYREKKLEKTAAVKDQKYLLMCKKCHRVIKKQEERCVCQPLLCYRCCECDIDCELCSCKHRKQKSSKK